MRKVDNLSTSGLMTLIILSISTFGLIWLGILFTYGMFEYIYRRIVKENYDAPQEDIELSEFGKVSLVIGSIFSLGFIWLIYLTTYGFYEKLTKRITNNKTKISEFGQISLVIGTILTVGLIWIFYIITIGVYELYTYFICKNIIKGIKYKISILGILALVLTFFYSFFVSIFIVVSQMNIIEDFDLYFIEEVLFDTPIGIFSYIFLSSIIFYIGIVLRYGVFEFMTIKASNGWMYIVKDTESKRI